MMDIAMKVILKTDNIMAKELIPIKTAEFLKGPWKKIILNSEN